MSDRFQPMGAERLAAWIAAEIDGAGSVFGIPRELWFAPTPTDRFAFNLRGARLETPIGVAAGGLVKIDFDKLVGADHAGAVDEHA